MPELPGTRIALARLLAAKRPDEAVALLRQVYPGGDREKLLVSLVLAQAYLAQGRTDLALAAMSDVEAEPFTSNSRALMAEIAYSAGDMIAAHGHATLAMKDGPLSLEEFRSCGYVLAQLGGAEAAIQVARERLERNGGSEAEWRLLEVSFAAG
jgi:hypothetical protein